MATTTQLTQMAIPPHERPRSTPAQLHAYFDRIQLPQKHLDSPVLSDPSLARTKAHGLPLVHALTHYHTSRIPFENLQMHYSRDKHISLDMDDLYERFVTDPAGRGGGGRCMQNNGFFGTVLRSLGFYVRSGAARVSRSVYPEKHVREQQGQTYDPWDHMVNFVKFADDEEWWLVDVGMAAMGPNMPIPIRHNFETTSIVPRKIRLQLRPIPEHSATDDTSAPDDVQKLWCFDICHFPNEAHITDNTTADKTTSQPTSQTSTSQTSQTEASNVWIPTYCFTLTEFLPQDYECLSWYTSTHPRSYFARWLLVTKMLLADDGESVVGDVSLVNASVRRTVGGKREREREELRTEEERVGVLREVFGICLSAEEEGAVGEGVRLG